MSITAEQLRELLAYDPETGIFTRKIKASSNAMPGSKAGCKSPKGYLRIHLTGRCYYAHRLAWLYMTGEWPLAQVDHINGERHDNRWSNLRSATSTQNQANSKRRKDNATGFKGVSFRKKQKKYRAEITVNGRAISLGSFATAEQAYAAYAEASARFYGPYGRLA